MSRHAVVLPLLAGLAVLPAQAQQLSPQQLSPQEVFRQVSPSVVVVEVMDAPKTGKSRLIASGSGVVIPARTKDKDVVLVATNCHVVDKAPEGVVTIRQGKSYGTGFLQGRDAKRDLCLVDAVIIGDSDSSGNIHLYEDDKGNISFKQIPAVQIGSSQGLEVGDAVYAVGAPQGLELSLSNGLVSGFRGYEGDEYIQTTAPISKGSSGGGLFDAQGRLVGITTMYLKDGQALNFAVPAELIASVPEVRPSVAKTASVPESQPTPASRTSDDDSRWMYVAEKAGGGEVFLDKKTARRSGSDVTTWLKTEHKSPQKDKTGDAYDELSQLITFHCSVRQLSNLSFVQRLGGQVVYSHERKSYEIEKMNIEPDTVGEAMFDAACSL